AVRAIGDESRLHDNILSPRGALATRRRCEHHATPHGPGKDGSRFLQNCPRSSAIRLVCESESFWRKPTGFCGQRATSPRSRAACESVERLILYVSPLLPAFSR